LGLIAFILIGASFGANPAFAAPEPAKAGASPGIGFDVSFPQCSNTLPKGPAFAIVGVNGGLAYAGNPCLGAEYQWGTTSTTSPRVSFYLNTGNPGPVASSHWPPPTTTIPRVCDGTWNQDCAYDYGWYAARDSFSRAVVVAGNSATAGAPWWLDVETANSWSTDIATNRADIEGAVAALRAAGISSIGIYSTMSMWAQITGATGPSSSLNVPFTSLPNWVPGARSAKDAPSFCNRSFSGGQVKLVQYPDGGFDADYPCQTSK
jgi:hypothetical protein